jgi:hypothetical protein
MVLERVLTDLRQNKWNKYGDTEEILSVSNIVLKTDLVIHKNQYATV